jgi:hypothetical protein
LWRDHQGELSLGSREGPLKFIGRSENELFVNLGQLAASHNWSFNQKSEIVQGFMEPVRCLKEDNRPVFGLFGGGLKPVFSCF